MRTRTTAATAVLLLATLTACGSDAAPEAENSTTPAAAPATTEPEAAPSPTEVTVFNFGDAWEFEGTSPEGVAIEGSETVLSYKQGIRSIVSADEDAGTNGYEWAALELKTCSSKGTFTASTYPWTLSYEDGTRIESSSTTYDDFPKPEYAAETKLAEGKCVRGKVVFAVPGNSRPATVVYAPVELDTPREWTVPAK
ncbi:hypothetical protein [Streptomyces sp. NPDC000880]